MPVLKWHIPKPLFTSFKAKYNPLDILLLYYYLFLTKGATGIIQSPGYPDAYTANVDCLWLLGAEYLVFVFSRSFKMRENYTN